MIFLHLSLPACSPCDVPSNKGWAGGREWRTINIIHSLYFQVPLFHIREVHPRRHPPILPPCLWIQVLLPIKSHPVSLSHRVKLHCVKLLLSKSGLSKVTFSCKHTIAYSVFSSRYDCYSADDALCAGWRDGGNCRSRDSVHVFKSYSSPSTRSPIHSVIEVFNDVVRSWPRTAVLLCVTFSRVKRRMNLVTTWALVIQLLFECFPGREKSVQLCFNFKS